MARSFVQAFDGFCRRVNRVSEIGIGLLIAATVAVTFLQVVCRYGLDSSLSWSEEFSRYAFIWAIFLGAGSVARRGQHMAVDSLRGILPDRPRHLLEIMIALVGIVFFAVFGYAAVLLTDNAMGQISTALEISIAVVYASAPIGAALTVLHLVNGIVQGLAGAEPRPAPNRSSCEWTNRRARMTVLGILLGVFLLLLVLGVPIAVAMGMGAIAAVVLATDLPVVVVGQRMMSILDSFPFLALPFFVVAGLVMERGGITQQLIDFATIFVARITGGLAQVVIGANLIMSGASGAATADCAATGTVLIPALSRAGYSPAFAAALTAAASTLGPIIPPSVMFVIYGAMTNTSIGKLFLGGVVPGLIMGLYMIVTAYIISKRRKYPKLPALPARQAAKIAIKAMPALLMPVIVVGGIVGGIFTPTEAGAVAAVYALIIATLVYRQLKWPDILPLFIAAATMTAAVMLIVSASEPFGWILARERIPDALTSGFLAFTSQPWFFLASVNVLLLLFGIFFEPVPLLILVTPVLMPLLPAYGIDPVHFGVMITLNMTIGLLTPPVGMCMFIVCAIGKITIWQFTKEVWPFLAALTLALIVITYVPATVLFLPDMLIK